MLVVMAKIGAIVAKTAESLCEVMKKYCIGVPTMTFYNLDHSEFIFSSDGDEKVWGGMVSMAFSHQVTGRS